jgi:hypothetical protein
MRCVADDWGGKIAIATDDITTGAVFAGPPPAPIRTDTVRLSEPVG